MEKLVLGDESHEILTSHGGVVRFATPRDVFAVQLPLLHTMSDAGSDLYLAQAVGDGVSSHKSHEARVIKVRH